MKRSIVCLVCAFSAGCGSKAATKVAAVSPAPTPQRAIPSTTTPTPAADSRVGVDGELVKRCKLKFASSKQAPRFGFDDEALLPSDRDVLQQVAACLTLGPLKGQAVQLIGRADPRGTEEYNLGLGTRRAAAVSQYLQRLGVPATQLATTTRGDIDANGSDELGWQFDRRVDLELRL
ncbi:peptidoglycan-associated lipoprotein Pal [soil metagenome]